MVGGCSHDDFLCALLRVKKLGVAPAGCSIQYTELSVMQSVCACGPEESGTLNVVELQQRLHISKPAVSQILNSLEKKGYVVRNIDAADRRRVAVHPTDNGRRALEQALSQYTEAMEAFISRFGEDNVEQLARQLDLLCEVYEELRREDGKQQDG